MTNDLNALFDEACTILDNTNKNLAKGDGVDLNRFENLAHEICDTLLEISIEQAKQYKDSLEEVRSKLENLSSSVMKRRDEILDNIKRLQKQKAANIAYTKSKPQQ